MEQTTRKNSDLSIASVEEQITAIPAAGRDLTLVSAAHAVIHAIGVLMPLIYPIIQVEYHLIQHTRNENTPDSEKPVSAFRAMFQPLRSRTLVIIMLVSIIAAGGRGLGNVTTYVPLYLQNILHYKSNVISVFFTLLLLGSVLGPLFGGRLSDRVGRKAMLLVFYGGSALTTWLFLFVAAPGMPVWLLPIALVLMGFVVYAESPLLQAYLADSASPAMRDTAFGLVCTSRWPSVLVLYGAPFWAG
jgi:predicted MFS family arabinose efflux permease